MPVQQSDIDSLNSALASGEKIVRINGKWIEYRSPAELIEARNDLQRQMAAEQVAQGSAAPRSRIVYHTQRGRGY